MVVLNKIYTRTGDKGTTALGSGERVRKDSLRVSAYGTVDETNAVIGMARVHLAGLSFPLDVDAILGRIQNDLFDLGADLCLPDRGKPLPYEPLRIVPEQVARLENEIDAMNAELKPLRSFVLPGGTAGAAALHVARTVCRRAERLGERGGDPLPQSPLRPSLRREPLRQRSRRPRRALGAGPKPRGWQNLV